MNRTSVTFRLIAVATASVIFEKAVRFPVLASLPYEPRMEAAVDSGLPLVLSEPRAAFSRRLRIVAAHVGRGGPGSGTGRLRRPAALWRVRFGR